MRDARRHFGHGGARREAERLGVPFLGEVPLHMTIARNRMPACRVGPPSRRRARRDLPGIAEKVRDQLQGPRRRAPKIVIGRLRRGVHSMRGIEDR